ncbi:TPA: hypothetical protein DCE37_12805 [Candidatus Latescibacteria bacterium]|nr:hypothetical protein [Candidatus Latescibacterota bacterium]|tara:strand:+ start:108 stop:581 length:474 start_codon:yes stop_codon:yes gene_type:complete
MRHLLLIYICLTGTVHGDTHTLTIYAHHGTHNSLVACITGILQSWDRDADYATVAGLSGVAFSPVYDDSEDWRAWWMEGGDDIRLDFLGQALGFTVETVRMPEAIDNVTPYDRLDDMPPQRADHFRRLKAALEPGDAVLLPPSHNHSRTDILHPTRT